MSCLENVDCTNATYQQIFHWFAYMDVAEANVYLCDSSDRRQGESRAMTYIHRHWSHVVCASSYASCCKVQVFSQTCSFVIGLIVLEALDKQLPKFHN